MKRIILISLAFVALLFTGACERDGAIYVPDNACVSFPADQAIFSMLSSDGNKITVELWRGNTDGAISIPVTINDNTGGVFKPSKTSFDYVDGQSIASIDFTYPDINSFGGETYVINLAVDESQVSPSGYASMTVKAQRKLTRVKLGTGEWYSDFWEDSWPQDLYTTVEAPNYYILPNCWASGTDFTFTVNNGVITWPATFDSGYTYGSYGNIWFQTGDSYVEDGVLYLNVESYYLPSYYNYDFGSTFEAFTLPAGVNL